jgi:hypothetical protein
VRKAYSEILNEIIEHWTFNYYLGKDEERIFDAYIKNRDDSIKTHRIDREVIRLQNKIYNDTTRFCTFFLDTSANWKFKYRICCFENDSSRFANQLRIAIGEISADPKPVFEKISSIQTRYLPKDFTLCTSKMKIRSSTDSICSSCCIGSIRLSDISFNTAKNKALLYFEFGGWYGRLLNIEKVNDKWIIKNSILIWQV